MAKFTILTRIILSLFGDIYSATKINFTVTRRPRLKFAYGRTRDTIYIDLRLESLEKAEKIHSN